MSVDTPADDGAAPSEFEQDLKTVASVIATALQSADDDPETDREAILEEANEVASNAATDAFADHDGRAVAMACWFILLDIGEN